MTTRRTRIHGKILDPKKFEKLPFHKGQVNFPASMTIGEPEEAIENEKRRNINNAAKWGKEDVNKAIKLIENDPNIVEYKRQKTFGELSSFFGNPKKNPRVKEALDKWRKPKDFNYIKKEQEVNKKKGGKRKTRRKRGRGKVEWDLLKNLNGENVTVKFNKGKADGEEMGETEFTALLTIEDGGNNDAIKIKFLHSDGEEEEHVFDKTDYENGIITVLGKSNSVYNKVSEAGGRKRKTRRKKRRKTRKNKRSKKRSSKKRKTRKRRKKRR